MRALPPVSRRASGVGLAPPLSFAIAPRLVERVTVMRACAEEGRSRGELPPVDEESFAEAYLPLASRLGATIQKSHRRPYFFALVGPPGCGKTTLAEYLQRMLSVGFGLNAVRFGIDDVYLPRAERRKLARQVHPLFETRGAPGTHNIALFTDTVAAMNHAGSETRTPLPRFDKSSDDPLSRESWPVCVGRPDVILFDTWLWEVDAPAEEDLFPAMNRRESDEDAEATWRRAAAHALREEYVQTFGGAHGWVLFETPSFDATIRFRQEQEAWRQGFGAAQVVDRSRGVGYFLELLERWIQLPHRVEPDYRLVLDDHHRARLISS